MSKRIAVVGAGAIGGYAGGHMTRAGHDVTLIDAWPEHVEYMRSHGLQLSGMTPQETHSIPVRALHITDVQRFCRERPIDIAFICVKSYDTEWATHLIKPYLAPGGYVVSLQNCINEERIAAIVGWGKTLGCIASLVAAELYAPGHVKRTVPMGGDRHTVFRVGEVHGRVTPRAEEVAQLLRSADSAKVTTNLWGERWSKLVVNSMRNGLSAATGLSGNQRDLAEAPRWLSIRLGSQAVRVGQALGYQLEKMLGMDPETLARAGEGNQDALAEIVDILIENAKKRSDEQRPSMAQDMAKGRRTETDFINGYVAAKGLEIGVPAPTHAKINDIVKRVERGELAASPEVIAGL
ncbi:MAG: 2-dehydropantoate 2-reductase, partial [Burkholderiales bacterium]|nr:2-dehydropantoate 2-reductase [Burkholderiales bacterium]